MESKTEENRQRELEQANAELAAALAECREQLARVEAMLDKKLAAAVPEQDSGT